MEEVKRNPNRVLIQAGWAHAPHLSQDDIEDMKRSTPPHLIDARMNGNPTYRDWETFIQFHGL